MNVVRTEFVKKHSGTINVEINFPDVVQGELLQTYMQRVYDLMHASILECNELMYEAEKRAWLDRHVQDQADKIASDA